MFEVSFSQASRLSSFFLLVSVLLSLVQASQVTQRLKRLPAIQETWVQSLGWEDSLEKEMATHSSILAWRIPWTEEPGGLQSMGLQRVGHNWATSLSGWDLCWVFVCLFVFPLMRKAEWGSNPVWWWLGLYFCFVCCLDEVSCTGCYWWLGDAGSCIPVVSSVWVLTIWYSLGLVL